MHPSRELKLEFEKTAIAPPPLILSICYWQKVSFELSIPFPRPFRLHPDWLIL